MMLYNVCVIMTPPLLVLQVHVC